MRQLKSFLFTLAKTIGIISSLGLVQVWPILRSYSQSPNIRTLEELYQKRDALITQIETSPESTETTFLSSILPQNSPPPQLEQNLLQQLQQIEVQILLEQRASDNWRQAISLANEAETQTRQQPQHTFFLQQAIKNLQEIPPESLLASAAQEKIQEYQKSLIAKNHGLNAKFNGNISNFLEEIANQSSLSKNAMITVCTLDRNCIHLHGDELPSSPASLIKVPVAVALLNKVATEKINLTTPVYVEGGNFTEDAKSDIQVRQQYPLKILMDKMIDSSSNIATNQLIDYLGPDYINQVLEEKGYKLTRVNYKLVGDRITPFKPGQGRNTITSDELTEMMVQIYNYEHPDSQLLIDALANQHDRAMGYAAVAEIKNVQWMGEKTGQNSRAIGTTVAVRIGEKPYMITVIDDGGTSEIEIRNSIQKIVEYISQKGGF